MPKNTDKNKSKKTKSKSKKSDNVDLMKDLPEDQLEDLEQRISDSDE